MFSMQQTIVNTSKNGKCQSRLCHFEWDATRDLRGLGIGLRLLKKTSNTESQKGV
jgi:hypothetical protein